MGKSLSINIFAVICAYSQRVNIKVVKSNMIVGEKMDVAHNKAASRKLWEIQELQVQLKEYIKNF